MPSALRWSAALALALATRDAHAVTELLKTHAGSPVHWNRAEIVIGLDADAGSRTIERLDVVYAIQRAALAWNRIPASQPRFRFTTEAERDVTVRFCRGQWQGDAIDLGKTQFDAEPRDGSVSAAVIEVNECDHRFTSTAKASGPFDLPSVLIHELGHVLGLGHSDSASTVMFPSGKGIFVRVPTRDDQTALAVLYVGRELLPAAPQVPSTEPRLWNTAPRDAEVAAPRAQPGDR